MTTPDDALPPLPDDFEVPDEMPEVRLVRAAREELRRQYNALYLAVALAVDDPAMRMEWRTSAGADAIEQMMVNLTAATLLADQLGVGSRDEAVDNLRAQLARFIARHGHSFLDDDPPDTQPTWRPR